MAFEGPSVRQELGAAWSSELLLQAPKHPKERVHFLRITGPQKYVKCQPFGLFVVVLGHCLIYFGGPDNCNGQHERATDDKDGSRPRDAVTKPCDGAALSRPALMMAEMWRKIGTTNVANLCN